MSRFNRHPSNDYVAAVAALKKLPLDDRRRAFSESAADEMQAAAEGRFGQRVKGGESWKRLIGKRTDFDDHLPGDDHRELRRAQNGDLTYFSHPYSLGFSTLSDIVAHCKTHGLEIEVNANSWHAPGDTLRVRYWKPKSPRKPAAK